jgi:hypothetical protein
MEQSIKDKQSGINKREHEKDKKEVKTEIEEMRKELGVLKDSYRTSLREIKTNIGTELFNR